MLNDYFWFRFFRRQKRGMRPAALIILLLLFLAGLIYAVVFISAAMHGAH